ncbi:MAG: hypothetical protein K2M10_02725 [Muribaculaceae bacterium]|nr:hypothetical protein [Muribaculaceae bacterium]
MKKSLLFSAVAGMLCLGSCSQDDFVPVHDGDNNGNVTFTVSLNDKPATRAFGDGLSATTLNYAAYDVTDENSEVLAAEGTANFVNSLSTTVSLNLVTGRDYRVVFFASNGTGTHNVYTFSATNKTVSVNYDNMNHSEDQEFDNDCFYNAISINRADLGKSLSVTLNRPVAQINFGTADLNESSVENFYGGNLHTTLSTTGYTTLNLLDGTVENEVEFTTTTPTKPITSEYGRFPVDGYDYLLCTYVLVPKTEKTVAEVTLNLYKDGTNIHTTLPVSNVPLQANYRTNIYGKLLTNATDITVTKDKDWSGEYQVPVWDGSVAEVPMADENGVISLSTPQQLAGLAKAVNAGDSFKDKTIKLEKDIDLNNLNWTPIGMTGKPFNGHFDGQGHTISNLSITQKVAANPVGLFGYVSESQEGLKNVKFDGVKIEVSDLLYPHRVGTGCLVGTAFRTNISGISVKNVHILSKDWTGGIVGKIHGNLDNCSAEDITLDATLDSTNNNGAKVGAISGYCAAAESGSYTTDNNTAKNVSISGYRDLGGLFGMMDFTRSMANNTITNVTIKFISDKSKNHGAMVGRWNPSGSTFAVVGEGNTFSNYTFIDKDGNESEPTSGTLTQADAK